MFYLSACLSQGCGLSAGTIIHPEIAVYRSCSVDSCPNPVEEQGYAAGPAGAVQAPGTLDIDPGGSGWSNFVSAMQVSQPYTVRDAKLIKQAPVQGDDQAQLAQSDVVQTGDGIRLHWSLMYDAAGTTYTLTINYSTPAGIQLPGEVAASEYRRNMWKWRMAAGVGAIEKAQELYHSLPFGRSGAPLISDESLHLALKKKISEANAAYTAGDFAMFGSVIAAHNSLVLSSRLTAVPVSVAPTGSDLGVADTIENPTASVLRMDSIYSAPRSIGSVGSAIVDAPDTAAIVFTDPKIVIMIGNAAGHNERSRTSESSDYDSLRDSLFITGIDNWSSGNAQQKRRWYGQWFSAGIRWNVWTLERRAANSDDG